MTQQEKQLLLKDLCARLPYNFVYCYCNAPLANGKPIILTPIVIFNLMNADKDLVIKPYLRPMSSMTDEEIDRMWEIYDSGPAAESSVAVTDYLYGRYLDCHHLIEIGLALEAPEGMYKTE